MTILVAYVPRPEGPAALNIGIEIAKRRLEHLRVVNVSPGGRTEDPSFADVQDFERGQELLTNNQLDQPTRPFAAGNALQLRCPCLRDHRRARGRCGA